MFQSYTLHHLMDLMDELHCFYDYHLYYHRNSNNDNSYVHNFEWMMNYVQNNMNQDVDFENNIRHNLQFDWQCHFCSILNMLIRLYLSLCHFYFPLMSHFQFVHWTHAPGTLCYWVNSMLTLQWSLLSNNSCSPER